MFLELKDGMQLRTGLQKGDRIVLDAEKRMISFFRGDKRLLFFSRENEMLFPWGAPAFGDLIKILSDVLELTPPKLIEDINCANPATTEIGTICYLFE